MDRVRLLGTVQTNADNALLCPFCLFTHRAECDSAAEEDDGEEGRYASRSSHPRHSNEDDDAEDVLNAWQVDARQGAQIGLCLWFGSGTAVLRSRSTRLHFDGLNCIIVIGQAREQ